MEPSIAGSVGEPPWALGKGQGSSQAPWLGRKKRAKGCLSAGEGKEPRIARPRAQGTWIGWGWAWPVQGPQVGLGAQV